MKLKRILATLIALAMVASIVPMAFAATAITPIDFVTNTGSFSTNKGAVANATFNLVGGIYDKAADDMVGTVSSPQTSSNVQKNYKLRSYMSGIALTKSKSRVSFQIAAGDKNSVKAVSFSGSTSAPAVALFSMETDGNMYVLGDSIGTYDVEKWYQIDIEFDKDGAYKAYVNGAESTGTSSEDMAEIFGGGAADSEDRYLHYYSHTKASHSPSIMYIDNIEVEVSDATSSAAVPEGRKLIFTSTATIENGTITDLADGVTVEDILAYFTVTAGSIKVVDSTGAQVTTGAVAPGMKVVLTSGNGLNVIEYGIDYLNLVFTVPGAGESTRELTKTVSVTFNGAGTVEFYVNNALVDTVSSAPYEYTIQHGNTSSVYTVKAVVVTAGDVRTESTEKTYSYIANTAPTITFAPISPADGDSLSNGDIATITVTATDSDFAAGPVSGVTKVEIYFGNAKVAEETCDPAATLTATYSAAGLARGSYSYYAKAYDADGAVTTTDTVNFSIIESLASTLDYADFENNNKGVWGEFQTTKITDVTDPAVREGTVKAYDATQSGQALYMKNDTNFFAGVTTLYWETDMMTSDPSSNKTYLQVRGPNDGSGEPQTRLYINEFGMEANKWYKIRYIVNASTGAERVEVYEYSGTGVNDTVTLKTVLTPATANRALASFASVRIYINENGGSGYSFYMDNIKLYTVTESTYVSGSSYANNQFVLSYNNPVEKYQFDETNFEVTDSNGKKIKDFAVSTVAGDITITFNSLIESQETYTVKPVNLDSRLLAGTAASYTFTTPAKDFDVLKSETTANADGTGAQVKFNAATGTQVEVIYAIYSGDKLIGIKRFTPDFGQGLVQNIPAVDWIGTGADKTAKVFVWSGITGARTVHTDVID